MLPQNDKSNAIAPTMADCLTVRKGMDLEGNSFWEIPVSAHGRVRRIVAYKDPQRDLVDYKLPRTVCLFFPHPHGSCIHPCRLC